MLDVLSVYQLFHDQPIIAINYYDKTTSTGLELNQKFTYYRFKNEKEMEKALEIIPTSLVGQIPLIQSSSSEEDLSSFVVVDEKKEKEKKEALKTKTNMDNNNTDKNKTKSKLNSNRIVFKPKSTEELKTINLDILKRIPKDNLKEKITQLKFQNKNKSISLQFEKHYIPHRKEKIEKYLKNRNDYFDKLKNRDNFENYLNLPETLRVLMEINYLDPNEKIKLALNTNCIKYNSNLNDEINCYLILSNKYIFLFENIFEKKRIILQNQQKKKLKNSQKQQEQQQQQQYHYRQQKKLQLQSEHHQQQLQRKIKNKNDLKLLFKVPTSNFKEMKIGLNHQYFKIKFSDQHIFVFLVRNSKLTLAFIDKLFYIIPEMMIYEYTQDSIVNFNTQILNRYRERMLIEQNKNKKERQQILAKKIVPKHNTLVWETFSNRTTKTKTIPRTIFLTDEYLITCFEEVSKGPDYNLRKKKILQFKDNALFSISNLIRVEFNKLKPQVVSILFTNNDIKKPIFKLKLQFPSPEELADFIVILEKTYCKLSSNDFLPYLINKQFLIWNN
ncbi:myb-like protein q [Anaeramoeba flamelloides]|uniref:Myb-like protein q n=1 Tax=Anaeramoeba flamelloides TaxID=1746091 RepID=A0AAV7Z359_9EUKA|nr:myb-like protein q [Anaeramoeba flamelloides]